MARPHSRDRQNVGHIHRVQKIATHVSVTVTRQASRHASTALTVSTRHENPMCCSVFITVRVVCSGVQRLHPCR